MNTIHDKHQILQAAPYKHLYIHRCITHMLCILYTHVQYVLCVRDKNILFNHYQIHVLTHQNNIVSLTGLRTTNTSFAVSEDLAKNYIELTGKRSIEQTSKATRKKDTDGQKREKYKARSEHSNEKGVTCTATAIKTMLIDHSRVHTEQMI